MVIASIAINKKSAIHSLTEIDISHARQQIRKIRDEGGPKISFTAFLVHSLAQSLKHFPEMNSFIRHNRLIMLEDVTVSILVERELGEEKIPEPLAIRAAQNKSLMDIHKEIRAAQKHEGKQLGDLAGATWIRFIPAFLLKSFVRIADRNIAMAKKYGKVAVTAVGMHSKGGTWFIPHGTATVLLTVGSITMKQVWTGEAFESREMLQLTASFDHEIIDGSPAARFLKHFSGLVEAAESLDRL